MESKQVPTQARGTKHKCDNLKKLIPFEISLDFLGACRLKSFADKDAFDYYKANARL